MSTHIIVYCFSVSVSISVSFRHTNRKRYNAQELDMMYFENFAPEEQAFDLRFLYPPMYYAFNTMPR